MNNLNELTKKMKEVSERAHFDVENVPANSRASHQLAKREAQDALVELQIDYQKMISNSISVILVASSDPSKTETFLNLVQKESILALNAGDIYKEMASKTFPMIGKDGSYLPDHAASLNQQVAQLHQNNGLVAQYGLDFPNREYIKDIAHFVDFVRNLVRTKFSDRLNLEVIKNKILKFATETFYSKKILPVVIYGLTPDELNFFEQTIKTNVVLNLDETKKIDHKYLVNSINELTNKFNAQ